MRQFVAGRTNTPPSGIVAVAGTPKQGQVLTAFNTLSDPDGMGEIHYQWRRGVAGIPGATNATYIPVAADIGEHLAVAATYIDGKGASEAVTSALTEAVTATLLPPETILRSTGSDQFLTSPDVDCWMDFWLFGAKGAAEGGYGHGRAWIRANTRICVVAGNNAGYGGGVGPRCRLDSPLA